MIGKYSDDILTSYDNFGSWVINNEPMVSGYYDNEQNLESIYKITFIENLTTNFIRVFTFGVGTNLVDFDSFEFIRLKKKVTKW